MLTDATSNSKIMNLSKGVLNVVNFNNAGTGIFQIGTTANGGTGTIAILAVTNPPHTIKGFIGGVLHTSSIAGAAGTAGNLVSVISSTGGSKYTIFADKALTSDYLSIQDIRCEGNCCYAGSHSTNVSGNLGWGFGAPSPVCPTGAFFGGGI
jgi:hypothetical protein